MRAKGTVTVTWYIFTTLVQYKDRKSSETDLCGIFPRKAHSEPPRKLKNPPPPPPPYPVKWHKPSPREYHSGTTGLVQLYNSSPIHHKEGSRSCPHDLIWINETARGHVQTLTITSPRTEASTKSVPTRRTNPARSRCLK